MMYGAETWTAAAGAMHKFKVVQQAMLGFALWNEVIRRRTTDTVTRKIRKPKWQCVGQVCRRAGGR